MEDKVHYIPLNCGAVELQSDRKFEYLSKVEVLQNCT